jgi:uracil-DNA glycosylase family 4
VTKGDRLIRLYNKYIAEFNCREIVTGHGNPDSGILLIGEAPGKDEVRLGRPFVGAAGKQLDEFLSLLGLNKDSMFITNAIKYRLAKRNEETGRISNRPAKADEIILNRSYLMEEVDIIKPDYIITLGNVPLRSVPLVLNLATYNNSPDRSTKSTPSSLNALRLLVNIGFQVLFHSPPGVLFTFPSRYCSSIGHQVVFSLGGWSPLLPTRFLVPRGTPDTGLSSHISHTGLLPSMVYTFQCLILLCAKESFRRSITPTYIAVHWFRLFRVRSPLLTESRLISFPAGT